MSSAGTDVRSIAQAICAKRELTLGAEVGSGAFKTTYRAVDAKGTSLALILVLGGRLERLQREIDAVTRCSHPNIGKLVDVGEDTTAHGPVIYLLEPFLNGGTLADRLNNGLLKPADVRGLAKLCGASVVLIHVADGFVARNVNQLSLRESEEMRNDREYI